MCTQIESAETPLNPIPFEGYESLDPEKQNLIRSNTTQLHETLNSHREDMLKIGQLLVEVQSVLANRHKGSFGAWLEREFGWSERTAYYFMSVYQCFGSSANFAELSIEPSVLYKLAAKSTTDEARNEVIERAEKGEKITNQKAKEIIEKYRTPEPTPEPEPEGRHEAAAEELPIADEVSAPEARDANLHTNNAGDPSTPHESSNVEHILIKCHCKDCKAVTDMRMRLIEGVLWTATIQLKEPSLCCTKCEADWVVNLSKPPGAV